MDVKVIKANPMHFNAQTPLDEKNLLRVCAYARVSTDKDEQEDSFERQVDYYTRYIQANRSWRFIKVFSDPGITGTRADMRPGFQEMIDECRKHNIDKILCKSLARFARNTVDALNYIRELKELGVGVYFESQNIDTSTPGGDVLLTILAAMAEEESRTISKNVKWAFEKKFEKGDFCLNYNRFLGYTRDADHNLIQVEEEARIVRRIFSEFLTGYSIGQIQNHLNEDKIPSPCKGKNGWTYGVIESMLRNEKYYGAALMGKTYKPDVLSKKRYKNKGQAQMYFAEGVIENPIIDKEMFDMVQLELSRRTGFKHKSKDKVGRFTSIHTFSKMIRCGCCGGFYTRTKQRKRDGVDVSFWWCENRRLSEKSCSQKGMRESAIEEAFVIAMHELAGDFSSVRKVLDLSIKNALSENKSEQIKKYEAEIDELQDQMIAVHKEHTKGEISTEDYQKLGGEISKKIDAIKSKKEQAEVSISTTNLVKRRLEEITEAIGNIGSMDSFNELIFRRLVESITINERYKVTFKFKVGIERTVDMTDKEKNRFERKNSSH